MLGYQYPYSLDSITLFGLLPSWLLQCLLFKIIKQAHKAFTIQYFSNITHTILWIALKRCWHHSLSHSSFAVAVLTHIHTFASFLSHFHSYTVHILYAWGGWNAVNNNGFKCRSNGETHLTDIGIYLFICVCFFRGASRMSFVHLSPILCDSLVNIQWCIQKRIILRFDSRE